MNATATWPGWNLLALLDDRDADASVARGADTTLRTFESVYADHYRDVYRYVLLSLRQPDDAEDEKHGKQPGVEPGCMRDLVGEVPDA